MAVSADAMPNGCYGSDDRSRSAAVLTPPPNRQVKLTVKVSRDTAWKDAGVRLFTSVAQPHSAL